ncbi:MAG: lycopene cyclase domain-containing protein [Natronomonas sp.]|jgi:lycopene cyclase domain-containing protein
MDLTYLEFHLLFLVPVLSVLSLSLLARAVERWRLQLAGLAVIVALALVYTTPWDNYLIAQGVWSYGDGRLAGRVWLAPVGEYLFILVQPVVAALWLFHLRTPAAEVGTGRRDWLVGLAAGGLVTAVGAALLTREAGFYLGAILAWGGPVLALQWAVGWRYLLAVRRHVALAVGVPTLYLWVADWVAIQQGVWVISARYTTGLGLPGLPVEEMVFFLTTNLFVVQGLVLLPWVVKRWR